MSPGAVWWLTHFSHRRVHYTQGYDVVVHNQGRFGNTAVDLTNRALSLVEDGVARKALESNPYEHL